MKIDGLTAIITGGASGMGAATARHLHTLGARIALLDIDLSGAQKLADDINGCAFECDITNEESLAQALSEIEKKLGSPRICINCAGVVHSKRMVGAKGLMPLSEFRQVISVNLFGSFNVMRLVSARMIDLSPLNNDGERGIIIHTASIAAFEGQIGQVAYSASKGGIVGLTLPAARELAQFGIRVMTIAPGLVDTPMFAKIPPDARSALAASVPFPKRLAKSEEYARLAQQIIENPMLNGSVIRLDGGLRMAPK